MNNEKSITRKLLIEKLNCNFIYNFNNRMLVQFKIYLFQNLMNEELDLRYGWMIRCPYCSCLDSVFLYCCENEEVDYQYKLTDDFLNKIIEFNQKYEEIKSIDGFNDELDLIELFVKIHYLYKINKKNKNEIMDYLKEYPWHTKKQIDKLFNYITEGYSN